MTLINLTMTLSVAMFLLQLCGIRVTGFVVEETLLFSRSKAALPSSTETLMLSSGNLIQQRKRELSSRHKINSLVISPTPFTKASRYFAPKQQRELAHFHHPQNINIENGSTARSGSISGTTKFSQIRDRLRGILRRNNRNDNANILKSTNNRKRNLRYRRMWLVFASLTLSLLVRPTVALAMGAMGGGGSGAPRAPLAKNEQLSLCGLFFFLFGGLALLHAAEIAITTLYPWKVKEFAEEEEKLGQRGTFKILNEDITRVLTTILVASTTCSIFATTVFTHLVAGVFGNSGEKYGALALTALTLFFVELLPKSIGVTNAESVARIMVPPINIMTMFVSPVGVSLSWLAKKTLSLIGLQGKDNSGITDSQLRLIVTEIGRAHV